MLWYKLGISLLVAQGAYASLIPSMHSSRKDVLRPIQNGIRSDQFSEHTILNRRGVQQALFQPWAIQVLPWTSVQVLSAEILHQGKPAPLSPELFIWQGGESIPLLATEQKLVGNLPDLSATDVVRTHMALELRYGKEILISPRQALPLPITEWTVTLPAIWKARYEAPGMQLIQEDQKEITLHAKDLPEWTWNPLQVPLLQAAPYLLVSVFDSWDAVASEVAQAMKPHLHAIKKQRLDSPKSALRKFWKSMAELESKYVAIQQPLPVPLWLQIRERPETALTPAEAAMAAFNILADMGEDPHLFLIGTASSANFFQRPCLSQFGRIGVGCSRLGLSCIPLSDLPQDQPLPGGLPLLHLGPKSSLTRTAACIHKQPLSIMEFSLALNADGSASGSLAWTPPSTVAKRAQDLGSLFKEVFSVADWPVEGAFTKTASGSVGQFQANLSISALWDAEEGTVYSPLCAVGLVPAAAVSQLRKWMDPLLCDASASRFRYQLRAPSGWSFVPEREQLVKTSQVGTVRWSRTLTEARAQVEIEWNLTGDFLQPKQLKERADCLDAVIKQTLRGMTLRRHASKKTN